MGRIRPPPVNDGHESAPPPLRAVQQKSLDLTGLNNKSRIKFKADIKPSQSKLKPNNFLKKESDLLQASMRSYLSPQHQKPRSLSTITQPKVQAKVILTEEEAITPAHSTE